MMNSILSKAIIFAAGAGIGSVVTWKLLKTKYEQIAEEEINSVREMYSRWGSTENELEGDEESEDDDEPDEYYENVEDDEYDDIIEDNEYTSQEQNKPDLEGEGEDYMDSPYIITPDEFEETEYETVTLYHFADGVVTTTDYEVVTNVDELIDDESLTHYGEYEADTVYVRNDNVELDFEIQRDCRKYSEIKW